ncbi:MAG: hypothetical protein KAS23_14155, partial [Anaerohalosphaera sp.]|nr:hypothetical protein [Anaerohalosphaera sp.]
MKIQKELIVHKTCQNSWRIITITLTLVLAAAPLSAETQGPNAADVYRKAFELYQPDGAIRSRIEDIVRGTTAPNEAIMNHLKANRDVIDMAVKAAKIDYCKWHVELSPLEPNDPIDKIEPYYDNILNIHRLSRIVLTDARACLYRGDIKEATEKYMTVYGICRHIDSKPMGGFIMMLNIESRTGLIVKDALSELDNYELRSLKLNLNQYLNSRSTFIKSLDFETTYMSDSIDKRTPDQMKNEAITSLVSRNDPNERIFFQNHFDYIGLDSNYYLEHQKQFKNIIQKPYKLASQKLKMISEKMVNDAMAFDERTKRGIVNYGAVITSVSCSPSYKVYTLSVKADTSFNALLCAIDVYIAKAKTGKLPDNLPADSPKDLFSGEDFVYER